MRDPATLRLALAAVYAAGAVLSLVACRRSTGRERSFWMVTAIILAALMVAKETHLIETVTGSARSLVKARGWYGVHHEVQWIATLVLLFATLVCAIYLFRWFHRTAAAVKAAAAALIVLLIVLILRAVSLHAVDAWSMHKFAGMRR